MVTKGTRSFEQFSYSGLKSTVTTTKLSFSVLTEYKLINIIPKIFEQFQYNWLVCIVDLIWGQRER